MNSWSFIIKECENQNWEGIITRIWPNTKYLDVIVTGLTIPSRGPSQRGGGKKYELVITTYTGGICRYRVGDILQITRFHNSAPQFTFIIRKNVLLRVDSDKTDEAELQNAVDSAAAILRLYNTSVVEYTST